jgi:hypothetical protein
MIPSYSFVLIKNGDPLLALSFLEIKSGDLLLAFFII